jgi:hypothetical protein
MGVVEAGAWGLAGGLVAGLISLSGAVIKAGFRWPWDATNQSKDASSENRDADQSIWPHMFVFGVGLVVGTLVAAAAHQQMSGDWPAFLLGAGAPSVVRGAVERIEVAESKPSSAESKPSSKEAQSDRAT